MFKKTNKKGFTLIELIVVVAIMAVLVALLAPNVMKYLEKTKVNKDIHSLDSVRFSLEAELMDDDLSTFTTGTTDKGIINGLKLAKLEAKNKKLHDRLFVDSSATTKVLSTSFKTNTVFSSKSANGAEIQIFVDGKGGIAVAAVNSKGAILTYDGDPIVVFTKIEGATSENIVSKLAPATT